MAKVFPEQFAVVESLFLPRPHGEGLTLVDALLLSPAGITVVSLELGDGVVFGQPADPVWTWKKRLRQRPLTNPLHRARFHARAVARFLEVPTEQITALACFPGDVRFAAGDPQPQGIVLGSLSAFLQKPSTPSWSESDHTAALSKLAPLTRPHQRRMSRLSYLVQRQLRSQ